MCDKTLSISRKTTHKVAFSNVILSKGEHLVLSNFVIPLSKTAKSKLSTQVNRLI